MVASRSVLQEIVKFFREKETMHQQSYLEKKGRASEKKISESACFIF